MGEEWFRKKYSRLELERKQGIICPFNSWDLIENRGRDERRWTLG